MAVSGARARKLILTDDADVHGGTHLDEAVYGRASDDRIDGSGGRDYLDGDKGDDYLDGGWDDDILVGDMGNDVLLGQQGEDELYGRLGDDRLDGGWDADHIEGNNGDDELAGMWGRDRLLGGNGSDRLAGSHDGDTLTGGRGADLFTYLAACESAPGLREADAITDFRPAEGDRIDLSAVDADATADGGQGFAWVGETGLPGAGEVGFERRGGDVVIVGHAGPTGDLGAGRFEIVLAGFKGTPDAGDLVL